MADDANRALDDDGSVIEGYYGQEYAEGTAQDRVKLLGERLRDYYSDSDFVTVMNIDTEPLTYQFANPAGYETFSDYPGHKNTVQLHPPQRVRLMPGQMKLCPAYEADLMIEALIKQMVMKKTHIDIQSGKTASSWTSGNWQDPNVQKQLIERIYKGKRDFLNEINTPEPQAQSEPVFVGGSPKDAEGKTNGRNSGKSDQTT